MFWLIASNDAKMSAHICFDIYAQESLVGFLNLDNETYL